MSRRLLWVVRGTFVLGAGASLAANVLHAHDSAVARTIAGWPPVALVLAVELISRIPVQRRGLGVVRLVATGVLAIIAAWVSYWHMVDVILRYGETGSAPYLIPVSVDGLMVVASICLVEIGAARKPSPEVIPEPEPTPEPTPEAFPELDRSYAQLARADAQLARADAQLAAARNPRGYVKTTAREVIQASPTATVPELVAAVVDRTGTHHKHATKTVRTVLQEGAPR